MRCRICLNRNFIAYKWYIKKFLKDKDKKKGKPAKWHKHDLNK
jgi:hypothetical protein